MSLLMSAPIRGVYPCDSEENNRSEVGVCHDHAPSENTDFQQVILLDEPCSAPGHLPELSSTGAPFKKFCMF